MKRQEYLKPLGLTSTATPEEIKKVMKIIFKISS